MMNLFGPFTSQSIPVRSTNLEYGPSKSSRRKPGMSSCWPPTDWKTAPDSEHSGSRNLRMWPHDCSHVGFDSVVEDVARIEAPISVEIELIYRQSSFAAQNDSAKLLECPASEPRGHSEEHGDLSGQRCQMANSLDKERIHRPTPDEQLSRRTAGRLESFGFSTALRAAFPQCVFGHWDIMSSDPLEPNSQAGQLVTGIQKRKGLKEQMAPLSEHEDKL